eukprot:COSAG02_NODE_71005_length_192_cov_1519.978495_1_plen_52_part_01
MHETTSEISFATAPYSIGEQGGVGEGEITNTTLTTTAGVATGLEQRITGNYK